MVGGVAPPTRWLPGTVSAVALPLLVAGCLGPLDSLGYEDRVTNKQDFLGGMADRGRPHRGQAAGVRPDPHRRRIFRTLVPDHHEQERDRHQAGHRPVRGERDRAQGQAVSGTQRGADRRGLSGGRRRGAVDGGGQRLPQAVQRRPVRGDGAGGGGSGQASVASDDARARQRVADDRNRRRAPRRRRCRRAARHRAHPGRRHTRAGRGARGARPRRRDGVHDCWHLRAADRLLHLVTGARTDLHTRPLPPEPRRRDAVRRARDARVRARSGPGLARPTIKR